MLLFPTILNYWLMRKCILVTKKYPVIMIYNNVHVMGINALIFWMPVQNWHGTYLHHRRDTVKCLKKYILFEYLVNAIIALLWGIIAWRFLLLAKQTPTFSLLSWVSYYSFKLLKMNALKVDLWPCFLSLSLYDSPLANESEKNSPG